MPRTCDGTRSCASCGRARSAGRRSWSRCCTARASTRRSRASAATCASSAWSRARDRYLLPAAEDALTPSHFEDAARRSSKGYRAAGPTLTVLRTTIGRRAERRRRDRQGRTGPRSSARSPATTRSSSRRRARARSAGCTSTSVPPSDAETPHDPDSRGRQAHPARLFRRPRHLVLRALARGDLRPPDRHASPSTPAASTPRPRACSRSARATLGAVAHHLVDARAGYFDQVLRFLIMGNVRRGSLYPLCVGAERVLQAQTVAQMARKLGTDVVAHGSHRRRQRPGALRGRAAHARAGARDPRAGARPRVQAARAARVPARRASCRCRRSAPPTPSTAACGA